MFHPFASHQARPLRALCAAVSLLVAAGSAAAATTPFVMRIPVGPVADVVAPAVPAGPATLVFSGASCAFDGEYVNCDHIATGAGLRVVAADGRDLSSLEYLEFSMGADTSSAYPGGDTLVWQSGVPRYYNCTANANCPPTGNFVPAGGLRINADGSLEIFNLMTAFGWQGDMGIFDPFAVNTKPRAPLSVTVQAIGPVAPPPTPGGDPVMGVIGEGTLVIDYVGP